MVGKKLRILRVERGETIVEAAKGMGIGKSSLSDYETGKKLPGDDVLKRIAEYYGVSLEFILGGASCSRISGVGQGNEKLCPLKVREVKHAKTGDVTRWLQPCLREKCMAYGKDGICEVFSKK